MNFITNFLPQKTKEIMENSISKDCKILKCNFVHFLKSLNLKTFVPFVVKKYQASNSKSAQYPKSARNI